jgi:hypothetical protein
MPITQGRIGILGYSWGGLAGALLATRIPAAKCLISFDGSEFHHYGKAQDENNDFDGIRNSPDLKGPTLNIPYLRLESTLPDDDNVPETYDSVYDFRENLKAPIRIYSVHSSRHEDFSCLPYLTRLSGDRCGKNDLYPRIRELTVSFLQDQLTGGHQFQAIAGKEAAEISAK